MTKSVTAIDVLLDPDSVMLGHAEVINARLRESFPAGFALDEMHRPHITMLQRYVNTDDLPKVHESVAAVFRLDTPAGWELTASSQYFLSAGDLGLAGIVVDSTDAMIELQQQLIEAVAPFTVETGTADAFYTTPEDSEIIPALIDYVRDFVPSASGAGFHPHVSTGIASRVFLDELMAEPFPAFSFGIVGASVYKLGNYGTAAEKLWSRSFDN